MRQLSITVVDDHRLFREGLRLLLQTIPFIGDVTEAADGLMFLQLLADHHPDLVFMDIDMPKLNGIETTRKALEIHPEMKVIALSMHGDNDYVVQMINAGAKGFILKNTGIEEVEEAIRQVNMGENYFADDIFSGLISNIQNSRSAKYPGGLSAREVEILCHICKGMSNQEIAGSLFISRRTVEKHRENLMTKTKTRNTAELVIFAIKRGIIDI